MFNLCSKTRWDNFVWKPKLYYPRGAAGTPQEEFRSDSAGGIHSCFGGVFAGYLGVFGGIRGYSLSFGCCKLMGSTTSSKVGGGRFGVRDVGIYNIRGGEAMRPPARLL